jgi:DNA polymerase III subunit epsilon
VNPEDHFDPINVSIHRITDETVVGAPTWPAVAAAVGDRLSGVAVSHTAFDRVSMIVHHVALEDARIAGQIILCAIRDTSLSVEDWYRRVEHPISQIAQAGNPEGPLVGYSVTFTGALSMVRADAARLAADAGCDVKNSRRTREKQQASEGGGADSSRPGHQNHLRA